ncbi:uncharacterized protein LOC143274776 isoform X2 [Babylonia areolata]|uniref:uncharacterized protein LOC143274776 isoform X2 n=1 Tax=Babylonia areolata TaxID=304850 RepID=UPI003FCF7D97
MDLFDPFFTPEGDKATPTTSTSTTHSAQEDLLDIFGGGGEGGGVGGDPFSPSSSSPQVQSSSGDVVRGEGDSSSAPTTFGGKDDQHFFALTTSTDEGDQNDELKAADGLSPQPNPFIANADPFSSNPDPFSLNPDPFSSNADPFSSDADPFSSNADPFSSNGDPFSLNPDPFSSNPDPFSSNADPFGLGPLGTARQNTDDEGSSTSCQTMSDPFHGGPFIGVTGHPRGPGSGGGGGAERTPQRGEEDSQDAFSFHSVNGSQKPDQEPDLSQEADSQDLLSTDVKQQKASSGPDAKQEAVEGSVKRPPSENVDQKVVQEPDVGRNITTVMCEGPWGSQLTARHTLNQQESDTDSRLASSDSSCLHSQTSSDQKGSLDIQATTTTATTIGSTKRQTSGQLAQAVLDSADKSESYRTATGDHSTELMPDSLTWMDDDNGDDDDDDDDDDKVLHETGKDPEPETTTTSTDTNDDSKSSADHHHHHHTTTKSETHSPQPQMDHPQMDHPQMDTPPDRQKTDNRATKETTADVPWMDPSPASLKTHRQDGAAIVDAAAVAAAAAPRRAAHQTMSSTKTDSTPRSRETQETLPAAAEKVDEKVAADLGDGESVASASSSPSLQPVELCEGEPRGHFLEDTALAVSAGREATQTGSGESTEEIECTMEAKATGARRVGDSAGGETSDDLLRLDDFIGVSETDQEPSNARMPVSSTASLRLKKKLKKKKLQMQQQQQEHQPSPVIVVEREGEEVESVTLKDAYSEKGEVEKAEVDNEEVDGGRGGEESEEEEGGKEEEMKTNGLKDSDMDFAMLEVVSSHLNLEVSKQKTSLRKKGSLAYRKRPSRSTVTLPPGASDGIFRDSTGETQDTVDGSSGLDHQMTSDTATTDTAPAEKKFSPRKLPGIVPGLQDLKQSKLFNQERKKTGEDTPPPVTTATTTSLFDSNLSASTTTPPSKHSPEPASGSAPEATSPQRTQQQHKPPVWLSEMKAKTSSSSAATPASGGSESAPVGPLARSLHSPQTKATALSSSSPNIPQSLAEFQNTSSNSSRRESIKRRGVSPEVVGKGGEGEPVWMKAALEKTSRMADRLQGQKDDQDNRQKEEDDDKRAAPPWAAELKRRNRPLVGGAQSSAISPSQKAETPSKNTTTGTREREMYTPSWAKRDQALSTSRDSGKPLKATNGSTTDVRGGKSLQTREAPSWQAELAEKKKRRQVESDWSSDGKSETSERGSGDAVSGSTPSPSSSSSSPSPQPQWKQQLIQRRKSASIPAGLERPPGKVGEDGGMSPSPEWMRQVEERRARLMKSGLLDHNSSESHC